MNRNIYSCSTYKSVLKCMCLPFSPKVLFMPSSCIIWIRNLHNKSQRHATEDQHLFFWLSRLELIDWLFSKSCCLQTELAIRTILNVYRASTVQIYDFNNKKVYELLTCEQPYFQTLALSGELEIFYCMHQSIAETPEVA